MKIVYGTGNKAKIDIMKEILSDMDIEIVGIKDVLKELPDVLENGKDPLENACIKAEEYYKHANLPVFSCDSGLFIEGLESKDQPGTHVRTIGGKYLSDDEMIDYYSKVARDRGGSVAAQYINAICFISQGGEMYKYAGCDISGEKFIISDTPHNKRTEGFPIDSLSIDIETGKYYYDLLERKVTTSMNEGFRNFFSEVLKKIK